MIAVIPFLNEPFGSITAPCFRQINGREAVSRKGGVSSSSSAHGVGKK